MARTAGRADRTVIRPFRTGASSVTFAQPVRATYRAPLTRPTDHFQGTKGPAVLRVRPSERDPARSLPARGTRRADHHCRSVLVASFGNASLWARVRCAWRNPDRQLFAVPVVVDVGGSFLVGTVSRLERREPMPLIEVPSSDVALESPQIEAVGVEFLCELDEPRPQTSPGPFRVHVEVGEPPVVEDQECHKTPVDFDHPKCPAGQDDRGE